MSDDRPADPATVFTAMARVLYDQAEYGYVYETLTRMAVELIPGCDHACISTLRQGEALVCAAASDEIARTVDGLERETGEGPCVDAMLGGSFQRDADIAHHSTWPALAELVLSRTPVRGMIGYRLFIDDRRAGALDLFSDTPGALTAESADMGAMVAAFTSVALVAAAHNERAESLRSGLHSNREIGKAIGLLMATHDIDDAEAFDVLRRASSELNLKLAEVAKRLIADHGSQRR